MKFTLLVAALATVTLAHAAAAQSAAEAKPQVPGACVRPAAPPAVDGATASMDQLQAAKTQAAAFIAASDAYQTCLLQELMAKKQTAKAAKVKFDKAVEKDVDAKVSENQSEKVAVGEAFNSAARAYRQAHPS